ncbi:MAG: helicase-related protein, partial [Thermus sp.]|uniref:helicase-related protein n=1 Tax=Thermus sp. TaxID=275 RepID=UPI00391D2F33
GGRPLFAPKLHQFLSQTRSVYATLEPPDRRSFRMEASLGDPPHFPLRFCRNCGQEHYLVVLGSTGFRPHPEEGEGVEGVEGYLTYWDRGDLELPGEWYDDRGKLKATWRERVPKPVYVDPKGGLHSGPQEGTAPFLWQKAPFSLCPSCGEYYTGQQGEFRKLTYLGSEGRTSAGTVLALSLLRAAREGLGEGRDKLLSFTDNRQDAALQAGHFNDFVRAVLLRAALRKALEAHGELHYPDPPDVATATLRAMDLPLAEYAQNPALHPESSGAKKAQEALGKVVLYRLYEDLRREWRFTQPNLEDVGLLEIAYRDLDSPMFLQRLREVLPALRGLDDGVLVAGLKEFMDLLRKRLAVDAAILKEDFNQFRRQSEEHLNEFWSLGEDDLPLYPATLVLTGRASHGGRTRGPEVKLSPRSRLGKLLGRLGLGEGDYGPFLEALVAFNLLRPVDGGFRIPESALIWRKGEAKEGANPFFLELYRLDPRELLGLEAREHTAQVVAPGERERRERRFRYTEEDRRAEPALKRLPFLVASPTLELGVDIADLDMVHLRNIPPSPANYAQRSGRAGRQGQMGLILAFAGAYSHHDQYFFRHREEMVAGAVRAPNLDLANEALLKA